MLLRCKIFDGENCEQRNFTTIKHYHHHHSYLSLQLLFRLIPTYSSKMPSNCQRDQRNSARVASILTFKKRKLEASKLPKPVQLQSDDNHNNISDTEDESKNWYWNENANKSCFDIVKERYSDIEEDDEIKTGKSETKIKEYKT